MSALRQRLVPPAGEGQADDSPHDQQQDDAHGEGSYRGSSGAASVRARHSRIIRGLFTTLALVIGQVPDGGSFDHEVLAGVGDAHPGMVVNESARLLPKFTIFLSPAYSSLAERNGCHF